MAVLNNAAAGTAAESKNDLELLFRRKGKLFNRQYQIVYQHFLNEPKTMRQVAKEAGVERANVCRYVSRMIEEGALSLIKKDVCPISGVANVGFYQANPDVKPSSYVSPIYDASMSHLNPDDNTPSTVVKLNAATSQNKDLPRSGRLEYSYSLFNLQAHYE